MYNVLLTFADLHDDKSFIIREKTILVRDTLPSQSELRAFGSENAFKAPIIAEIKSKKKKGRLNNALFFV